MIGVAYIAVRRDIDRGRCWVVKSALEANKEQAEAPGSLPETGI